MKKKPSYVAIKLKSLPEELFAEVSGGKTLEQLEKRILKSEKKKKKETKLKIKIQNKERIKAKALLRIPKIIGLTGGIGTGKTVLSHYLESLGIPVYISDIHAKNISKNKFVVEKIRKIWGDRILTNGRMDRSKLAEIIFEEPAERKKLNKLIHPLVKEHWEKWLIDHAGFEWVVKESAILLEVGGEEYCEHVICVFSARKARIERIMARDKVSKADAEFRINSQWYDKKRFDKSDFVIENNSIPYSIYQLDQILKKILI